jgi:membrane protein required for colicin V production
LSKVDIVLLLIVLLGAWSGYKHGFLMELVTLVGIFLGVLLGFKLMGEGMLFLEDKFNADKEVLPYLSFAFIFIVVVVLVSLLGRMIKASINKTFLGTVDQSAGSLLGAFKTLFMLSIVLWIADSLRLTPKAGWVEDSWLYPFTATLAPRVTEWIGGFLPVFKEIFRQF